MGYEYEKEEKNKPEYYYNNRACQEKILVNDTIDF
jgi:hypothetical protein